MSKLTHGLTSLMTTAALAALLAASATAANAATVAVLEDGTTISWVDTTTSKVTGSVKLDGGASLVGIDVRPADGKLYGLAQDGTIVTVDPKTGKWEKKSQLSEKLPAGATFSVDFNPVADRLRVIASDGTNLRINVDDGKTTVDGKLKYAETDQGKGKSPRVTAAGYINSVAGTKETALYDIDADTGWLLKQAPPNDGVLVTVGALGVKIDGPMAFDIWSDGKGGNSAWLLAGGKLHDVDLKTGVAKAVGTVMGLKGRITDMAILPGG